MAKLSVIFLILAIAASAHAAAVWLSRDNPGQIVTVESETTFCSFLPKDPGGNIGESEDSAIAFCTQGNPTKAPGAKQFPEGFIKTAHFKQEDDFVQITGTIDRTKYSLSENDGGGQYDTNAPPGAVCAGFKNFVNLVEPDINRFCIRCCNDKSKCKVGISTAGCEKIVPGDYS